MKNIKVLTLIAFSSLIVLNGCRKDKDEVVEIDNSTVSSTDNSVAESLFGDMKKVVEEAADDEGQSGKKASYSFGVCATVTTLPAWTSPTFPKTMEIDFGPTNCTGTNGVNRRGKLVVTLTDHFRNSGSVLTVQPQNYFINDIKVEGTKTITNNGYNASNNLSYGVNVSNAVITYTDNSTITWNSIRTTEWIDGDSTTLFTHGIAGICDDVYSVTGSGSGVNRNGLSYTVQITSPLVKQVCCRWLVSGSLDVLPQGFATRSVDYGAGICDNDATVTINGNVYNISMW
jgi:hypothetical protein